MDRRKDRAVQAVLEHVIEHRPGARSRAVMLAVADLSIEGVPLRQAEAVTGKFGIESQSSSRVSRALKPLDEELEASRNRPPGETGYLLLDARTGVVACRHPAR